MRMGAHAGALAGALAGADLVRVLASPELGWDAGAALAGLGERATACAELDRLEAILVEELRAGDRVVLMSNGSFGGLHGRLLAALESRRGSQSE